MRRVIWNSWKSIGKLKFMKNQSFEVLCHKQIWNARRGSREKSTMKQFLDDSHFSHFWSTSQSLFSTFYIPFQISGSQRSNASNGAQFRVELKELQPLQAMPCAICLSYEHLVEECPTIPTVRENDYYSKSAIS